VRDEDLRRTVEEAQKHPVAHREGHVAMMLVIVPLGVLLGLKEMLPDLLQECVAIVKHSVSRLSLSCPMLERK
jgi:hypothetical protein